MDAPLGKGQRQWDEFFPLSVKLELFPVQACGFWLDPSQALHFTLGPGTCLAQGLVPESPLNPLPHSCSQLFSLSMIIFSLPLPSPAPQCFQTPFQNGIWARPSVPHLQRTLSRGLLPSCSLRSPAWLQPGQERPRRNPQHIAFCLHPDTFLWRC